MRKFLTLATLLLAPIMAFAHTSADAVYKKINERMTYMPDVALFKAQHQLAIEDLQRESVVLEKAKTSSANYQLDSESIDSFTVALMSAAKAIQYRRRAELLSVSADEQPVPRDLKKVIRPALLKLGGELNSAIASHLKMGRKFTDSDYEIFVSHLTAPYLSEQDKVMIFKSLQKITLQR
ncbi:gamma subclass chorismate mutase AroQ [Veronia pacifica]|uniref:chorismate mutase n=1 Tax=Veronia pacifica TaxID=1080227 RepID=A0A1C3EF67_9GAMM|nr:gamma subclass chorismate mutase AroQ [Veronia pacifica]ODA31897.1 hypothetical protein A8L45_14945 [Veronia pacifica]